jgi:hypothetical protein
LFLFFFKLSRVGNLESGRKESQHQNMADCNRSHKKKQSLVLTSAAIRLSVRFSEVGFRAAEHARTARAVDEPVGVRTDDGQHAKLMMMDLLALAST